MKPNLKLIPGLAKVGVWLETSKGEVWKVTPQLEMELLKIPAVRSTGPNVTGEIVEVEVNPMNFHAELEAACCEIRRVVEFHNPSTP